MYHHFKHKYAPGQDKFWVVTTVSNPERFRSRYDLYGRFMAGMDARNVNVLTVEIAYGDRPFEVTEEGNPKHLQLRTHTPFWNKERALNRGVQVLPSDWEKVAWVDADIEFFRPDWAEETCHMLERYPVVQLFESAVDIGPNGENMNQYLGWGAAYIKRNPRPNYIEDKKVDPVFGGSKKVPYPIHGYDRWHPGYAWGYTRRAYDDLGGWFDVSPLGANDHHMAWAFVGEVENTLPHKGVTEPYRNRLKAWQEQAHIHIRGHVGYVNGTIIHHWHGSKADRKYAGRWEPIIRHRYNPDLDIKHDRYGLWQFTHAGERMRLDFEEYFRQRAEDAVSLLCLVRKVQTGRGTSMFCLTHEAKHR